MTDSEIELDPATGLPTLPEGEFWRVTEGGDGYYKSSRPRVSIMRTVTTASGFWPFKKVETKTEMLASTPISILYVTESGESVWGLIYDEETKEEIQVPLPSDVPANFSKQSTYSDDEQFFFEDSNITKANILTTAIKVLSARAANDAKREANHIRQTEIDALVGDYPPKTLA